MKKDMQKKIEEIKSEKKMPENLKQKARKKIFINMLMATIILLYFIFLILISKNVIKNIRKIDFNIFSSALLIISIIFFEIAYKKDSGSIAMYGIETLIVAIITVFFSYIVFELSEEQKKYFYMIGAYFGVYYVIKSICINISFKNKYKKYELKEIKEVIEPSIGEKRESLKRNNKKDNEDIINDENEINLIQNRDFSEEELIPKINKKAKKEIKTKKITKEIEPEIKTEKRRGRPKKLEIKEENKKIEEIKIEPEIKAKIEIKTEKRRGRPKKIEVKEENKKIEEIKIEPEIKKVNKKIQKEIEPEIKIEKRRGRPKKTEIKENKKIEKEETKPIKKRGRPRKVV
jgi:hypothetical protein